MENQNIINEEKGNDVNRMLATAEIDGWLGYVNKIIGFKFPIKTIAKTAKVLRKLQTKFKKQYKEEYLGCC